MTRAQVISRHGWVAVVPTPQPADPNPFPLRFHLFRPTLRRS